MLLASRWTIQRRVAEFGLEHLSKFDEIGDDELDQKVRNFMQEHGCFVGSSRIRGYLRSLGIRIQRDRIRKSLARIDPRNARIRWAMAWPKQLVAPRWASFSGILGICYTWSH